MLVLMLGIVTGVVVTSSAGVLFYKHRKSGKTQERYNAVLPQAGDHAYSVFVASSLDRVFKDGKTLVKPDFTAEANISAGRHEYESFQVVVYAAEGSLTAVNLSIAPLKHKDNGALIDPQNVFWRVVGYVPTIQPYYPVKYVGLWPDPLLVAQPVDIAAKAVQPFWVTVYVPEGTAPGDYISNIEVRSGDKMIQQVPFSVHVYDLTLPRENHFKTAFDFYGHHTRDRYFQGEKESTEAYDARLGELNEKYIIEMLKYRLNPVLNIDPTDQGSLGAVDRYRWYGLNNFSIGKLGGTFNNNWPSGDDAIAKLSGLYQTYGEILKLNKMLPYTYIYTWDEGDVGNPKVAKICAMIHKAYKGLKNMVCYHGFWEPEKDPQWGKDIDIWCFNNEKFKEDKIRALQKIGIEIWMYISGPSGLGGPNLAIDFDSLDYRVVTWIAWKYDIRGLLYWCVNWWPKVDPFKSAANTDWEQNGNGLLFYPGTNGPIASLRLEIIRDGIEDYEYLTLLKEKMAQIEAKNLVTQAKEAYPKAKDLLNMDTWINSMFDYKRDNNTLRDRRDRVGQTIEALDNILKVQPK